MSAAAAAAAAAPAWRDPLDDDSISEARRLIFGLQCRLRQSTASSSPAEPAAEAAASFDNTLATLSTLATPAVSAAAKETAPALTLVAAAAAAETSSSSAAEPSDQIPAAAPSTPAKQTTTTTTTTTTTLVGTATSPTPYAIGGGRPTVSIARVRGRVCSIRKYSRKLLFLDLFRMATGESVELIVSSRFCGDETVEYALTIKQGDCVEAEAGVGHCSINGDLAELTVTGGNVGGGGGGGGGSGDDGGDSGGSGGTPRRLRILQKWSDVKRDLRVGAHDDSDLDNGCDDGHERDRERGHGGNNNNSKGNGNTDKWQQSFASMSNNTLFHRTVHTLGKSALCKQWQVFGVCSKLDCRFEHGARDMEKLEQTKKELKT